MKKKVNENHTYCQIYYMGGPKLSEAEGNDVGVLRARPHACVILRHCSRQA